MTCSHGLARARGFILISSLIILLLLSLMGAAMVNLGTINLRIVNNTQRQMEARSVAQRVIDQIISTNFAASSATLASIVDPANNPYTVALADAGYTSYRVTIREQPCIQQFRPFPLTDERVKVQPPPVNACVGPYCLCVQGSESLCADTLWRIRADVSEGWFGANESVVQGVSLVVDVENSLYQRALEYESKPTDTGTPYCTP